MENIEPKRRGRGRPKGATSLEQIALKDLIAQLPSNAIVTVGSIWRKNMGIGTSTSVDSSQVSKPAKVEEKEETAPIQLNEINLDDL
jgi:hypothetical protein